MTRFIMICLLFAASLYAPSVIAAETRTAEPGRPPAKASVVDLAWLVGQWDGTGMGGVAHLVYSAPFDGQIVGHFRQSKAGKIQFYEIATIAEVAGSLEYRVKHFNADLTSWEEKAVVQAFPLVAVEKDVWFFDGYTVRRKDADNMVMTVLIKMKDGTTSELPFTYRRAK